eukprot:TRINITY_DN414_c0_g1_i1.p1 TRINITY_DN414_c0_g1~~TRINITY_DN414_c0_g1_i1.p1  ORF type:complete len:142 (+),score=16.75 TRINITY_DN414_c0_g1_i1:259-684(+)
MPFRHSTLGCFDDLSVLCDTLLCPCCQMSRQCSAAEGYANQCGSGMCLLSTCFFSFFPMCLRCKVSDRYQLDETWMMSCLIGLFCATCSVCATGRELNFRGVNPGGSCCAPTSALQQPMGGSGSPTVVVNVNTGPQSQSRY